jgi:hypothetical protein
MKGADQILGRTKRSMDATLPDIIQAFGETRFDLLLHKGLWCEDQPTAAGLNLQIVSWSEPQLVMQFLRDHDLPTDPELNGRHREGPFPINCISI